MYRVAIFDLNGTIIEDEWIWKDAFNKVFSESNLSGEFVAHPGIGVYDNWKQALHSNLNLSENDLLEFVKLTLNEYQLMVSKAGPLRKGYPEFERFLFDNKVKKALATSSSEEVLTKIKIQFPDLFDKFDVIIHGDEVKKRKPFPDIFLKALDKINSNFQNKYDVSDCVVFEDSNAGVQAAKSAEMFVVHLPNGMEQSNSSLSPNLVVQDFTDKRIYELFEGGEM